MVRRMLELIRNESSLNVRILTRSGVAKVDFDLMKSFGNRLVFGMSLPTLNNELARFYEPNAPSPSVRLETLRAAKAAGLHVYVTLAPTYPEYDEADLRATLTAIKELDPITIFHEPINVRGENVGRIQVHADKLGIKVNTEVFATQEVWEKYAIDQLKLVERIAAELGVADRLHSWPDKSFETKTSLARFANVDGHLPWLRKCWDRVSEWPGKIK
jgi:DNA repair photolyase